MQVQEGNLFIWGKNYPLPTIIRPKVTLLAAGENHIVFATGRSSLIAATRETYGMGSNKFGQLGLKEAQFHQDPVPVFEGHNIASFHCGAEHTFFITGMHSQHIDKYQVYSCGLNIKGQLGHSHFQNLTTPKLVPALLPFGTKNSKSLAPNLAKPPRSPIVDILQKFDLQVKIDDSIDKVFLLGSDEYVSDIACGALFTIALTNKGRVLTCGLLGGGTLSTLEEQLERTRFKEVVFDAPVACISAGLSGAAAISNDGTGYFWGKFGRTIINVPRKVELERRGLVANGRETFVEGRIGDEFAVFLTSRGQVVVFGENIDNQLGRQSHALPHKDSFDTLEGFPLARSIVVGRNGVFAIEVDSNDLFAWGSNRYGQLLPRQALKGLLRVTNSGFKVEERDRLVLSSYFALLVTRRNKLELQGREEQQTTETTETVPASEYRKLLQDYQLLKAVNMALLQKQQPARKEHRQVQTPSKFQISGVTQFRKFNSNTQIAWKEIQLQSQINQGGYGVIYRARWREIQVVVKKFKIENGDVSLRDFLSQCHAMEAVRHPNIVMFLGAVTSNPHYSLVLEYCPRGSLWSYLQNKDNNIPWEQRRRLALQIAQGVLYLHQCSPPILHRDLKSLNIFLDASLRIKIGDFGWTKTLQEYMTNKIGTYQWMAPEVIGSKPYTEKADVFSYSIILWEIASREPPYRNINGAKVSEEVLNRDLRPTIPPKCPEGFAKLMKKCWESDPNRRPGFRQVIRQLEMMKLA